MDIDVGQIERIKVCHDCSKCATGWFLESIVIVKKYSTCRTISDIHRQRVEHIAHSLYCRTSEQSNNNESSKEKPMTTKDVCQPSKTYRSILRRSRSHDRNVCHKTVTWNEQSITSHVDALPMEYSSRTGTFSNVNEKQFKSDSFDHQIYWISSHSYDNDQWTIESIEENIHAFDIDRTRREQLLSDRLPMKTFDEQHNDEIYQFDAHRWLTNNRDNETTEVYLMPVSYQAKETLKQQLPVNHRSNRHDMDKSATNSFDRPLIHDVNSKETRPSTRYVPNTIRTEPKDASARLNTQSRRSDVSSSSSSRKPSLYSFPLLLEPDQYAGSSHAINDLSQSVTNKRLLSTKRSDQSSTNRSLSTNPMSTSSFMINDPSDSSFVSRESPSNRRVTSLSSPSSSLRSTSLTNHSIQRSDPFIQQDSLINKTFNASQVDSRPSSNSMLPSTPRSYMSTQQIDSSMNGRQGLDTVSRHSPLPLSRIVTLNKRLSTSMIPQATRQHDDMNDSLTKLSASSSFTADTTRHTQSSVCPTKSIHGQTYL
jgi:hypothetical protein